MKQANIYAIKLDYSWNHLLVKTQNMPIKLIKLTLTAIHSTLQIEIVPIGYLSIFHHNVNYRDREITQKQNSK